MESMYPELEVIAEFIQGRIIPRRVRYYELSTAAYVEKNIESIYYEKVDFNGSRFGIRFQDNQAAILSFYRNTGRWKVVDHL